MVASSFLAAAGLGGETALEKHEFRLDRYPMRYPRIAISPERRRDLRFLWQRANDQESVLTLSWPMSVIGTIEVGLIGGDGLASRKRRGRPGARREFPFCLGG